MSSWRSRLLAASTLVAGLLAAPRPAWAVIRVDFPVSKIYAASKTVTVGTITRVHPENRVLDCTVAATAKGQPDGDRFRVQIVSPPDLIQRAVAAQPVVVFVGDAKGKPVAVVHLADTWLFAQGVPGATPPAWRVVQPYNAARSSFPGRTPALVRLVAELKEGQSSLQDEVVPEAFEGGARKLADLGLRPVCFAAADLNADATPDLLVGTAAGARLFLTAPQGYADATEAWGLAGAPGSHAAFGDVNGDAKPDLLLGPALWLHAGGKFTRARVTLALPPEGEWLAVALADATGDARPDLALVLKTGQLLVCRNPGSPEQPWPRSQTALWQDGEAPGAAFFSAHWGDNGELHLLAVRPSSITRYAAGPSAGAPADYARLTGAPLSAYKGLGGKPLNVLLAAALDYDGNRKTDLVLITEGGGLALSNRGLGTFIANDLIHPIFHARGEEQLPFALSPHILVAPGRTLPGTHPRQNLLVLTPDGQLFEMDNAQPPPAP